MYLKQIKKKYLKYRVLKDQPNIIIMNRQKDLKLFKKFKGKKILVQHTSVIGYQKRDLKTLEIIKLMRDNLDYIVTLSEKSKEILKDILENERIKYVTIRHSCELKLLKEDKKKSKKLIMITRLDNGEKRIDLAIRGMKKLSDYTLDIYGDGKDREFLKKLIEDEGLESRVTIHNKTNLISEKLDQAGIFIITSDQEGYAITSIEAMTRGLPIIVRNTFESAEDIVQGNGVLLSKKWNENEFIEAVEEVYKNYEEYSKKSLELAKSYQLDKIEKEWKKLISEM